jgi:hypothetical protein
VVGADACEAVVLLSDEHAADPAASATVTAANAVRIMRLNMRRSYHRVPGRPRVRQKWRYT